MFSWFTRAGKKTGDDAMASAKRLIVGLGNPGPEYEQTRHNIGFMALDAISAQAKAELAMDRGPALYGCGRVRGRPVCLLKPQTFMNRSGAAVLHYVRRMNLDLGDLLVILDDINLDLGVVRLRQKGSAGGHNGVQDIIDALETDDFPRLRIGIGNDFGPGRQSDYVLSAFRPEERIRVDDAVLRARNAATVFICEGMVTAMNRFNRK
jgi:PTH1 family peptidyl-tRNA hydrolase